MTRALQKNSTGKSWAITLPSHLSTVKGTEQSVPSPSWELQTNSVRSVDRYYSENTVLYLSI